MPISAKESPLSDHDFVVLAEARRRARKVRRAAAVALFGGCTTGFFAAVSILFGLLDPAGLAIGLALALVAFNELRGGAALRRFEPHAPTRLALNQVGCAVLSVIYAAIGYRDATTGPGIAGRVAIGDPNIESMIAGMESTITLAVYAGIAVGGLVFCGSCSLYYATRRSWLRGLLNETPTWALGALRITA